MVLLEFRPITRGRLRRSRVVFITLALIALGLYACLFPVSAFPGSPATWMAWVAGLDVREVPTRPLLTALGHWVAGLPFFTLAVRLNLLSALAGALAVGWVYKLVWFLIFEMMREESAVVHASRNARFGGFVGAAAVAVSLPFMEAATRFGPEIFDVAGVMGCAYLLTVYARSQRAVWLVIFGGLYGLGMAESPLFLAAAPVMAVFAVIVEWKLEWCRVGRLYLAAWSALIGLTALHYGAARGFILSAGLPVTRGEVIRVVVSVLRDQLQVMGAWLPKHYWFPALLFGVGAAGLSFLVAFRMLDNRRNWSLLLLSGVLTVFSGLVLLNAPLSPWGVLALKGSVPAFTYTLGGIGVGLLAASWRAVVVMNDPVDIEIPVESLMDEEDEENGAARPEGTGKAAISAVCRGAGLLAVPILVAMVVISGILNIRLLKADDGSFADRAANDILDRLQGRMWVLSNGLFDPNLLIGAHERGMTIRLLCPYRAREPRYGLNLLRVIREDPTFTERAKLKAKSLITFNLHLFIDDWFAGDPSMGDKAVCLGLPDLWYGSEWAPVPEGLFFGGVRSLDSQKGRDLLAEHEAFWQRWRPFLDAGAGKPRQLSGRYRNALRRHFSFVANNLGVTLDDLGRSEEAYRAYIESRSIWPDNVSTLLNLFELVSRGRHPEMKDVIQAELRHKVENPRDRYPLWALSRFYGYVRNYGLFVRMGWAWALSSSPGSVLAGLQNAYSVADDDEKRAALTALMASVYAMRGDYAKSAVEYRNALDQNPRNTVAISGLTRLALQQNVVTQARRILEEGEAAGAPKRLLRRDWAAVYLVAGDLPRARVLLQELSEEPETPAMTLAMLAMVMIEQQETSAVESKILPRLAKQTQGKDAYFAQVIQGRIWQSKGKAGYKNARLCYARAALLRPDVQALQDMILMLDASMEDRKAAEAHALSVLRQRPKQPYANFIMGSIRLEEGQYGDAESYLRRSVETSEPTLAALNNFAQVLCRIRKLDEAETMARRATRRSPDRYEAWATLAFVLAMKGEGTAAAEALETARSINRDDPRLFLVDGLIAVKRGDAAAATKAAAAVGAKTDLSVADRRELQNLRESIALLVRQSVPGSVR